MTGLTSSLRPGASAVFSSRGFIENSLGVLFNGVRVQSSTITMRNYDAFNFDRVEVLRGPASVLHGEGTAAGAINFVRREPIAGRTRREALVEAGDAGRIRLGAAAAGSLGSRSSYSVSFARNQFHTHVEDNAHEYNHLAGAVRTAIGHASLGVEGDWLVNSVDDAYWGTPLVNNAVDTRLFGRNYNRSGNNRYDDSVGWGRMTASAPLGRRAVYNGQVYGYRADRDWRNSYGFEFLPATIRCCGVRSRILGTIIACGARVMTWRSTSRPAVGVAARWWGWTRRGRTSRAREAMARGWRLMRTDLSRLSSLHQRGWTIDAPIFARWPRTARFSSSF